MIYAVAGVLKQNNTVLMASRPDGKIHAGSWEFPGGKLETGETTITALVRELNEEIGVIVNSQDCEFLTSITQDYTHGTVKLDVVLVKKWHGDVVAVEGQKLIWQDLAKSCLESPLLITTQKILDLLVLKYLKN